MIEEARARQLLPASPLMETKQSGLAWDSTCPIQEESSAKVPNIMGRPPGGSIEWIWSDDKIPVICGADWGVSGSLETFKS
jgi:hypothetical protein